MALVSIQYTHCQLFVLHSTATWHQPGLGRGFVDKFQKLATNRNQTDRQIHSGIYRVPPATKKVFTTSANMENTKVESLNKRCYVLFVIDRCTIPRKGPMK